MKITKQGVTITEVPGLASIQVEPDENSEHGVHILLTDTEGVSESLDLAEAREYRDAITEAIGHAESMATSTPPAPGAPRIWYELDEIPEDVKAITDREGDPYFRTGDFWGRRRNGDRSTVIDSYAPYTELVL